MNIELLLNGGTRWQERLEDSLRRTGISWGSYTKDKASTTKKLVQQRLLYPIYVPDLREPVGERWTGVFRSLDRTEDRQTITLLRNQFFPPMGDLSLPKRWYLLPAKRWEPSRGNDNMSVREAQEEQMNRFTLSSVATFDDLPIGFDFEGVGPNTDIKPNTAYNWRRAREMYKTPAFRKHTKVTLQVGREDLFQAFTQGIRVTVTGLPSLSGESAPHDLVLTNMPVYQTCQEIDVRTKRIGYGISTSDDCGRSTFSGDKFSRKIKTVFGLEERARSENEFDHHSIFGIEAACNLISAQYPGLSIDNPIPELPKGFDRYLDLAFTRIRVLDKKDKNGGYMLWESNALTQIYSMTVIGYLNDKRLQEQRGQTERSLVSKR